MLKFMNYKEKIFASESAFPEIFLSKIFKDPAHNEKSGTIYFFALHLFQN